MHSGPSNRVLRLIIEGLYVGAKIHQHVDRDYREKRRQQAKFDHVLAGLTTDESFDPVQRLVLSDDRPVLFRDRQTPGPPPHGGVTDGVFVLHFVALRAHLHLTLFAMATLREIGDAKHNTEYEKNHVE
jgi:hypothetical protein